MIKILYLYNKNNWALHNVGKLWFSSVPECFSIDMVNYHLIEENFYEFCKEYDYVWFGYLYMYIKFNYTPERSIVSVHDPMELFPQIPGWKETSLLEKSMKALKSLKYITTISNELFTILQENRIKSHLLLTTTLLPLRDDSEIQRRCKPVIITIADNQPRKNLNLFYDILFGLNGISIGCKIKVGVDVLPESEYISVLDGGNIYLCTSYQEGGPIPAMDAMARGCVIITTPVGQMTEIIEDGMTGYICNSKQEFLEKIILLTRDIERLYQMRVQSIRTIARKRARKAISEKVLSFLHTLKK